MTNIYMNVTVVELNTKNTAVLPSNRKAKLILCRIFITADVNSVAHRASINIFWFPLTLFCFNRNSNVNANKWRNITDTSSVIAIPWYIQSMLESNWWHYLFRPSFISLVYFYIKNINQCFNKSVIKTLNLIKFLSFYFPSFLQTFAIRFDYFFHYRSRRSA